MPSPAEIVVPEDGGNGVLVSRGGAFDGWVLYLLKGKPVYCYNLFGVQRFKVHAHRSLTGGEHQVRMEFNYDGGGLGKGGTVTLYVDGETIDEGRVEGTVPIIFSADETTDVGDDTGTSVTDDFRSGDDRFDGRVRWIQLDVGADAEDADHYVTAEERLGVAMSVR